MRHNAAVVAIFAWALIALGVRAQTPTGGIAGRIIDPTGAAISGARVVVMNKQTGAPRALVTTNEGDYSAPALLAGVYQVTAEAPGFQRLIREAIIEAGSTTTVDLTMQVGPATDSVTVEGASPQMRYDNYGVGGVVTHTQIQGLPLNGRSFLELAKLEPGAQPPTRGSNNRTFVPVLGQTGGGNSGRGTRLTVDGGSIMAIGNGGSAMGFSQEVVQEFQISTVNFDLTTGLTDGASVNVVTRSGSNVPHGTAFYSFRDHHLAAYPALRRDPANPDPFFQRRQFGFALGGPIRRDRLFFFGNWERNEQRGVVATTLLGQDFAHFSRITATPLFGDQFSVRLDGRITNVHTAFVRYSHDGSRAFVNTFTFNPKFSYPSNWTRQQAWADQTMLGLTSVLRPTLVNDLRFSYFFISSSETSPTEQDCPGCLGIGAPDITIPASLEIGRALVSHNLGRRFHLNDSLAWQRGTHRARFGVDWEHNRGGTVQPVNNPFITLFSPRDARQASIPIPAAFNTLDDILQLPLRTVSVAVGDPRVPQAGGGTARRWNTLRLYFQDTWRIHPRLTVNYGLGWNIDRNLNYDLSKPALLAPILGADGLGPTRKQWKNFSPLLGLAWTPSSNGKTVIRAGAGMFYDFLFPPGLDDERALLGPPGLGQQTLPGSSIACSVSPPCPSGMPLDFPSPTQFTGANLMSILPAVRAELLQKLANANRSVQAIQVTKTGTLNPAYVPSSSALHTNVGFQQEIAQDFVVSADFVYRHFTHLELGGAIDLNHFDSKTRGPVIPKCSDAQKDDPQALCSNGAINVWTSAGRVSYRGLLLRADKRLSHGFQLLGSYAYSSNTGTNGKGPGSGFNLDNWFENRGPVATDITHILNLAGVVQLPRRFEVGLNFSYSSAPPFSAYVGGIDFNGDGTKDDLLPGTTVNAFNRGMGRADLERLVAQFNQTYAGTKDSHRNFIPFLTLPPRYSFGHNFQSLDLRLSRSFVFRDRWRLSLIGEVFNLYNAANLSGYSGDLTSSGFGQPTSRFTQVFGSGGPRAFQLGARISF